MSGLTVLVRLSAVLVAPAPAVRTMAVGIMLAVIFVLAATMPLLPAALSGLGSRIDKASLPWAKAYQPRSHRSVPGLNCGTRARATGSGIRDQSVAPTEFVVA